MSGEGKIESSTTITRQRKGEPTAKKETPIVERESFTRERGGQRKRPQGGGGGPTKRGATKR